MRLCKFNHNHSLLCDETRFWVVGPSAAPYDWYEFREASYGQIVDAVNLDEGLVHLLMSYGAVVEVKAAPDTGFVIQTLRIP